MKNFFKSITEAINNLKAGKIDINNVDTIRIEDTDFNLSQNGDDEFTLCITKEYDIKYDITNDIYPNSIDFAERIYDALTRKKIVVGMAPMQYGKTATVHYLSNNLLARDYRDGETTLFLTGMSDTALLIQNKSALEDKKFYRDGKWYKSVTYVAKMVPDFRDNTLDYLRKLNVKTVIFDECDYGSGKRSVFNKNLFSLIRKNRLDVNLVLISATPYCAVKAVYSGELDAEIVQAQKPHNYFGVSSMLDLGLVTDINNYTNDIENPKTYRLMNTANTLSNEFMTDLDWFIGKEKGGLSIVRAESRKNAVTLKQLIENYSDDYEVIAVGVKFSSIKSVLGNESFSWEHAILHENKKIVLIVINALSAGKDLGELKQHVRLVVETRRKMIANGSQGLVGRICGYHTNRDIRIIASTEILRNYIQMENDIEILQNQDFINDTVNSGLDFSTQLKKASKSRVAMKYETVINGPFTFDEVFNESYKVLSLFEDSTYGVFEDMIPILNGNKSKFKTPINTQRSSKYKKHPKIFDAIWDECVDGTLSFANRFHRFRAEANDERRLRIKRGIIINDELKQLFIIDRIDDGTELHKDAEIKNTSCYNY